MKSAIRCVVAIVILASAAWAQWSSDPNQNLALSNIPGKPDLTDEDSNWRRNVYLLGVTYLF